MDMNNVQIHATCVIYMELKYTVVDVLDLEVSTEEIQTLNEDSRPVWDTEVMTCPMAKCPSHLNQFKTFKSYMIHWTKMHVSTKKLFKCSSCKKNIQAKHKAQHGR